MASSKFGRHATRIQPHPKVCISKGYPKQKAQPIVDACYSGQPIVFALTKPNPFTVRSRIDLVVQDPSGPEPNGPRIGILTFTGLPDTTQVWTTGGPKFIDVSSLVGTGVTITSRARLWCQQSGGVPIGDPLFDETKIIST